MYSPDSNSYYFACPFGKLIGSSSIFIQVESMHVLVFLNIITVIIAFLVADRYFVLGLV